MPAHCKFCDQPICARGMCRKHYAQAWFKGEHANSERKASPLKERLLSKVRIRDDGCWEFYGNKTRGKHRYGYIWVDGKNVRAHRVSFEIHKGHIPQGMNVLHSCDFPACINPDHLFLGTRADNNHDAVRKHRNAKRERHGNAKLTERDVEDIRRSDEPQKVVAKRYGVTQSEISRVRSGELWKPKEDV